MNGASRGAAPRRGRLVGDTLRRRLLQRAGLTLPDLPSRSVPVAGMMRTYVAVEGPRVDAPLLLVLHGAGGTGLGMAALTGLHTRGPAAGCAVIFPDGVGHVWNDNRAAPRLRAREGVDDVAFIRALVNEARRVGLSQAAHVFALGISNGGLMAEHLARHGLLELDGIVLVAAGATVRSRQARPVPAQCARFLAFHGTADPLVPYRGGPIGPLGRLAGRRAGPGNPGRGAAAPIEEVAADWAFATDAPPRPGSEAIPGPPGDLQVERLVWPTATGASPVLYRVIDGGHTWPGGAPYLPARFVGPVVRHLDATGLVLEFVREAVAG
jgi:polyhydroxybutyrate depolymerase